MNVGTIHKWRTAKFTGSRVPPSAIICISRNLLLLFVSRLRQFFKLLSNQKSTKLSQIPLYLHNIFASCAREIGGYYCSVRPILLSDIYPYSSSSSSVSTSFSPADPEGITSERIARAVCPHFIFLPLGDSQRNNAFHIGRTDTDLKHEIALPLLLLIKIYKVPKRVREM